MIEQLRLTPFSEQRLHLVNLAESVVTQLTRWPTCDVRLRVGPWELQYDVAYGPTKRRGWSAVYDGSFLSQHETLGEALQAIEDFTED